MELKTCPRCGKQFLPRTPRSRLCGSTACRRRAAKAPLAEVPPPEHDTETAEAPAAMVEATRTELAAVGLDGSPLGTAALVLAARIDRATHDTGSSYAALVKEWRTVLSEATRHGVRAGDPVDELRLRRERRRRGA